MLTNMETKQQKPHWTLIACHNQVIINELLFNTSDSLPEFVELYNRSNQIQNLKNWGIGVRNAKNEISNTKKILDTYFLYPF